MSAILHAAHLCILLAWGSRYEGTRCVILADGTHHPHRTHNQHAKMENTIKPTMAQVTMVLTSSLLLLFASDGLLVAVGVEMEVVKVVEIHERVSV